MHQFADCEDIASEPVYVRECQRGRLENNLLSRGSLTPFTDDGTCNRLFDLPKANEEELGSPLPFSRSCPQTPADIPVGLFGSSGVKDSRKAARAPKNANGKPPSNNTVPGQPPTKDKAVVPYTNRLKSTDFPFASYFVRKLLANMSVFMMGDSLIRTQYKDLLCFITSNELVSQDALKMKDEPTFAGDRQVAQNEKLFNGPLTQSARIFNTECHLIQYKFVSRCLNVDAMKALCGMVGDPPDVLIMNSALWDVTRYLAGREGPSPEFRTSAEEAAMLAEYADRMWRLMRLLHVVLPPDRLVIWLTTPPIKERTSRVLGKRMNVCAGKLVHDANYIGAQIVRAAGYDVIDVDFYLQHGLFSEFEATDGVHWYPEAVRLINTFVIDRIAVSWNVESAGGARWYAMNAKRLSAKKADFFAVSRSRPGLFTNAKTVLWQNEENFNHEVAKHMKNWRAEVGLLRLARIREDLCNRESTLSHNERKALRKFDKKLIEAILEHVPLRSSPRIAEKLKDRELSSSFPVITGAASAQIAANKKTVAHGDRPGSRKTAIAKKKRGQTPSPSRNEKKRKANVFEDSESRSNVADSKRMRLQSPTPRGCAEIWKPCVVDEIENGGMFEIERSPKYGGKWTSENRFQSSCLALGPLGDRLMADDTVWASSFQPDGPVEARCPRKF